MGHPRHDGGFERMRAWGPTDRGESQLRHASSAPFDFHVKAGGPGIDTGMNLAAVSTDFDLDVRSRRVQALTSAPFEYGPRSSYRPPVVSGVFHVFRSFDFRRDQLDYRSAVDLAVQYGLTSYTASTLWI